MFLRYPRLRWLVSSILLALLVWLLIARAFRPEEWQPSPPYAGPHQALIEDAAYGFLPLREARDYCQRRRWEPFATRDQHRKVYDMFLINTELDFLELRLNELDKEVDYFVVLESTTTFQMDPKPLFLKDNLSQFKDFQHKIIHRVLDDSGAKKIPKDDTWEHERFTRYVDIGISFSNIVQNSISKKMFYELVPDSNWFRIIIYRARGLHEMHLVLEHTKHWIFHQASFKSSNLTDVAIVVQQSLKSPPHDFVLAQFSSLWTNADSKFSNRNALFDQALLSLTGAQAPNQGDVLLVGDIDEIPRIGTLTALRNCAFPPRVTLRTQMYYYSYQWLHRGDLWHHPQATYFDGSKTVRPESLRAGRADAELNMAGWHCSSCFRTMGDLRNKITSFSHKGYNQPYFLDTARLLHRIRRGEDLFERPNELYDRIDDNPDIPAYLQREDNRQKFAYMLDRDSPNGNFRDIR